MIDVGSVILTPFQEYQQDVLKKLQQHEIKEQSEEGWGVGNATKGLVLMTTGMDFFTNPGKSKARNSAVEAIAAATTPEEILVSLLVLKNDIEVLECGKPKGTLYSATKEALRSTFAQWEQYFPEKNPQQMIAENAAPLTTKIPNVEEMEGTIYVNGEQQPKPYSDVILHSLISETAIHCRSDADHQQGLERKPSFK